MTYEPRALPHDWADVKAGLQRELPRLVARLGITEPARGGLYTPRNPTRQDRRPGSFVIWTEAAACGAWKDYATGEGGDVFDLIAYLAGLADKMSVYWWALEFLGLGKGEVRTKDQARADRERFERERKAAEARADAEEGAKAGALLKLWLSLPDTIAGTPAERYLVEARGIALDRLPALPGALRWCSHAEWIDPATGEVEDWRHCMVAAMTRGAKVTALHRTLLKPDGSGKAAREKTKLMYGRAKGAAIRLAQGATGLRPSEAEKRGKLSPLIVGEGIETVLTCAAARPDYRAWAAGSLSLMMMDWPGCASGVVLLRENDLSEQAVAYFQRVEAHWRDQARGRPVKVAASAVGSDFNDWVKA